MSSIVGMGQVWGTASVGAAPNTSSGELTDLREHVSLCGVARGRLFATFCITDALRDFLVKRFVTSAMLIAIVIGAVVSLAGL
jgi:hypothetical protein